LKKTQKFVKRGKLENFGNQKRFISSRKLLEKKFFSRRRNERKKERKGERERERERDFKKLFLLICISNAEKVKYFKN
jgi:hypothetical protein